MSPSDPRLADIIGAVAEGIISIDERQRIVLFNPGAEQMFGRSGEEMKGQPLSALVPERFRELHDRVGQNVTALGLNLNMVRSELPADVLQKMSPRLNDCESLLYYTAQLVRDIQIDLRPPGLDELGLVAALNEHARQVAARSSFKVTVSGTEPAPRLPPAAAITLFRIAQEALNNITKHARATEVSIALEASAEGVVLTVADDGCGFDPAARPEQATRSLGMVSMRERAESIGGKLRVESAPGGGTRVIVEAPRGAPAT